LPSRASMIAASGEFCPALATTVSGALRRVQFIR
jgi:hypothetical protein